MGTHGKPWEPGTPTAGHTGKSNENHGKSCEVIMENTTTVGSLSLLPGVPLGPWVGPVEAEAEPWEITGPTGSAWADVSVGWVCWYNGKP